MSRLDDLESRIAALENKTDYNDYGSDFLRFGKDVSDPSTTAIVLCLVDGTYNGENFVSGEILFNDNSAGQENIVYKSGVWQVRLGTSNNVTLGTTGIRIVNGGLAIKQTNETVTSGTIDLTENGDKIVSSYIRISASTGNFTINSIAQPVNPNHFLILLNDTANNMTIQNVAGWVAPGAGQWGIETFDGTSPATTGIGIALLMGDEANSRWNLIQLRG